MESVCETLMNVLLSVPCVTEWTATERASVRHILRCVMLAPKTPEMCNHINTEIARLRPRVFQDTRRLLMTLDRLLDQMFPDDDSEQTEQPAP